jgi:uncharacterized metal-binding protein
MNTVLDYLAIDILTMYENNIKQHFIEYIERYVNVVWRKKAIVKLIKKKFKTPKSRQQAVNKLCNQLRQINQKPHQVYIILGLIKNERIFYQTESIRKITFITTYFAHLKNICLLCFI